MREKKQTKRSGEGKQRIRAGVGTRVKEVGSAKSKGDGRKGAVRVGLAGAKGRGPARG